MSAADFFPGYSRVSVTQPTRFDLERIDAQVADAAKRLNVASARSLGLGYAAAAREDLASWERIQAVVQAAYLGRLD